MTLTPDDLLRGPRGRRLCLEYALDCAHRAGTSAAGDAASVVWWAAHAFESETGGTAVFLRSSGDSDAEPFQPPQYTAADAAAALDSLPLQRATARDLRGALARSVGAAMYWQSQDGVDRLCATPEMMTALRRVATRIAAAPESQWWTTGVDTDDQWAVPWEGEGRPSPDTAARLGAWRDWTLDDDARAAAERPDDAAAPWSGAWWSIPPHDLVHTTRTLGADGPAGLWFVEDFLGWEEAVATPLDAYPARVIEIDGPDDWADLCRRHPLDVSASRRQDWYRVTGRDGAWVIPDWVTVAAETDAVHLTVRGYLSAATRLIDLGDGRASVIAGWNPDTTYWFRGVSARPAGEERWRRNDDEWERVDAST